MLISKFPAAFAVKFLLVPRAFAQTQTRLPEVGVSSPRAGAQGNTPFVTSTGAKTVAPLRAPAARWVGIPKQMLRARSALPLDDATSYASSPVRHFPVTPLARRAFCQFLKE